MSDSYTDLLSEYLDGELDAGRSAEVETHLAGCAECATVLRDLERVRERAASLPDRPPERDLWPAIAAGMGAGAGAPTLSIEPPDRREPGLWRRRFALSLPQLAAAATLLVMLGGGAVGVWLRAGGTGEVAAAPQAATPAQAATDDPVVAPAVRLASVPAGRSAVDLDRAIRDLEGALARRRSHVDPGTLEVIDRNIAVIDTAIAQIRKALAGDPSNLYLNRSLTETMWRKLDVLQVAARAAGVSG